MGPLAPFSNPDGKARPHSQGAYLPCALSGSPLHLDPEKNCCVFAFGESGIVDARGANVCYADKAAVSALSEETSLSRAGRSSSYFG